MKRLFMNHLIAFYNGILMSIIMCYIIYRLNIDLKRPPAISYLSAGLFIATFTSQIDLIFPGMNNILIKAALNILVFTFIINIFMKYTIYFSLLTAFLGQVLLGLGSIFVNFVYVYPLRISIQDYEFSIKHISVGSVITLAFIAAIFNLVANKFIRARGKLHKRYKKITIMLSVNLFAIFLLVLFAYNAFEYYVMYRKINNFNDSTLFSTALVLTMLITLILWALYVINHSTLDKLKYDKLKERNIMDPLTEIYNRGSGIRFLKEQLEICKKSDKELTICFIDINDLKVINDTLGHKQGDKLIKTIVESIKGNIRETDVISRLGGDEFIVIFPGCNMDYGERVLRRIKKELKGLKLFEEYDYNISFSYGFSEYDGNLKITVEELLDNADKQMYLNKREIKAMA